MADRPGIALDGDGSAGPVERAMGLKRARSQVL
jgi:hypothetical protein